MSLGYIVLQLFTIHGTCNAISHQIRFVPLQFNFLQYVQSAQYGCFFVVPRLHVSLLCCSRIF